jgi:hypothetical protein
MRRLSAISVFCIRALLAARIGAHTTGTAILTVYPANSRGIEAYQYWPWNPDHQQNFGDRPI